MCILFPVYGLTIKNLLINGYMSTLHIQGDGIYNLHAICLSLSLGQVVITWFSVVFFHSHSTLFESYIINFWNLFTSFLVYQRFINHIRKCFYFSLPYFLCILLDICLNRKTLKFSILNNIIALFCCCSRGQTYVCLFAISSS